MSLCVPTLSIATASKRIMHELSMRGGPTHLSKPVCRRRAYMCWPHCDESDAEPFVGRYGARRSGDATADELDRHYSAWRPRARRRVRRP